MCRELRGRHGGLFLSVCFVAALSEVTVRQVHVGFFLFISNKRFDLRRHKAVSLI